jgi:hypothetical protein
MWRVLKDHPSGVFELIGQTVGPHTIKKIAPNGLMEGQEFVNGDYVSSTDELFSWVSEAILEELRETLRDNGSYECEGLYELMKRALTGHIMELKG